MVVGARLRPREHAAVSPDHLLTVLLAALCLTLGIMAMLSRAQRRPGPVLVESALIVAICAMGAWLLASQGRP